MPFARRRGPALPGGRGVRALVAAGLAACGIAACSPDLQPVASVPAGDGWREFEGTWTAAGNRHALSLGPDRRASIADLNGALLLIGPGRPGVGFRAEAIVLNDSVTGTIGRAVWTDAMCVGAVRAPLHPAFPLFPVVCLDLADERIEYHPACRVLAPAYTAVTIGISW